MPHHEHLHRNNGDASSQRFGGAERGEGARAFFYLGELEGVEEGDEVPDEVEDGVGGVLRRRGGAAVAAEVGRDAAVAARGQVPHLVAPRVPQLREPVHEQHRGGGAAARPRLRDVHRDPVRLHRPVPYRRRRHGLLSALSRDAAATCGALLLAVNLITRGSWRELRLETGGQVTDMWVQFSGWADVILGLVP